MFQSARIYVSGEARWPLELVADWPIYNGRHHTTVLHAIGKVENLRGHDESVDALLEVLTAELTAGPHEALPRISALTRSELIETIVTRVMERLTGMRRDVADADDSAHVPSYPSTLAMAARNSD